MKNFILLLGYFLLTTGCATKFLVPANRFILPESSGPLWRGDAKGGLAGTGQVQVAESVTSVTPDTTPVLSANSTAFVGVDLALLNFLDVYYSGLTGGPHFAGVKLQILGDPVASAKAGNFSVAVAGGTGFGNQTQTNESGGVKADSELKFSGWEGLVLLGYRPGDQFLIYLAPFTSHISTDTTIKQTASSVTTTVAEPNGSGDFSGVNFGFRWGYHFFVNAEGSYINMKWNRENPTTLAANDLSRVVWGVVLGGAW